MLKSFAFSINYVLYLFFVTALTTGLTLGGFSFAGQGPDPVPQPPPNELLPEALLSLGEPVLGARYAFLVDKAARTLSVWQNLGQGFKLEGSYPTDMGKQPGDKHTLGDHRTPEGIYFFQEEYFGSMLNFDEYGNRAFTMDYPNLFDRLENKTGSGIWLHAIPESKSLFRGSRGCVVVRNQVIDKLKSFVDLKQTPIIVRNKVSYVAPAQHRALQEQLTSWLNNWRLTWQGKNLVEYMEHYDDRFKSLGRNKLAWQKYKAALNAKYKDIKVQLGEPMILKHQNEYVLRFLQHYQSDHLTDQGIKTLYAKGVDSDLNQLRILHEAWEPVPLRGGLAKQHQSNTVSAN